MVGLRCLAYSTWAQHQQHLRKSNVSNVYWYAPFDNAGEMGVAEELARRGDRDLTEQSIAVRFGCPFGPRNYPVVRLRGDMPLSANERHGTISSALMGWPAADRSKRRSSKVHRGSCDLPNLNADGPTGFLSEAISFWGLE